MKLDIRVNGSTKLTGLIGNPVEHTVSPVLHNTLFLRMGLNGIYIPIKPERDCLGQAVAGLKAAGFTGFNVTIPFKEAILEHLDDVSSEVRLLGTANTVHINKGRLVGYNTDGDGFIHGFRKQTGAELVGKSVCILGAGGTARTLAVKLAVEGADKICIINRTQSRANEIVSYINSGLPDGTVKTKFVRSAVAESNDAYDILNKYDVIINTTSVGMFPEVNKSPIKEDFEFISKPIVYDVIYNPAETKLIHNAKKNGCITANGTGMLFFQGLKAFEIWMGINVPENAVNDLWIEFLKYLED